MCVALWWLETTCGVHKVASVIEKDVVYFRNLPVTEKVLVLFNFLWVS